MDKRRTLPGLILSAKLKAESYRVHETERGFNVWRFRPWSMSDPGWRIVAANVATRALAERNILERLGLAAEEPKLPVPADGFFIFADVFGPY